MLNTNNISLDSDSSDSGNQEVQIQLRENQLSCCVSLFGASKQIRGYRANLTSAAPIREDLAAGLVVACHSFLQEHFPNRSGLPTLLFNPFAGSGTLGFEALFFELGVNWLHLNRPMAITDLVCCPDMTVTFLRKKKFINQDQYTDVSIPRLIFVEIVHAFVSGINNNIRQICSEALTPLYSESDLGQKIIVEQVDFFSDKCQELTKSMPEAERGPIFWMINPPYGYRIKTEKNLVTNIAKAVCERSQKGDYGFCILPDLKQWEAFWQILSCWNGETRSHSPGEEKLGMVTLKKIKFKHGGMKVLGCAFIFLK